MKFIKIENFLSKKSNFHTHSTFCDGHDTPSEIFQTAWQKRFSLLGFSSHAMFPLSDEDHIPLKSFDSYCKKIKELSALSEKLKTKKNENPPPKILLGFEAEFFPKVTAPTFEFYKNFSPDFLIGAVHYIPFKEKIFAIDSSKEELLNALKNFYGGNAKNLVCEYFDLERQMLKLRINEKDFQILSHPDLIRKYNEDLHFFCENDEWYKRELIETAKQAKRAGIIIEINTGGISRGFTKTPYPSLEFLKIAFDEKIPITINSDCHNKIFLDGEFEKAVKFAKSAGYTEVVCDL